MTDEIIDCKTGNLITSLAKMIDKVHEMGLSGEDNVSINVTGLEAIHKELSRLESIAIEYARKFPDQMIIDLHESMAIMEEADNEEQVKSLRESLHKYEQMLTQRLEEIRNG